MDRRTSLKLIAGGAAGLAGSPIADHASYASSSLDPYAHMLWGPGFEGQRPTLYSARSSEARFANFTYRAL